MFDHIAHELTSQQEIYKMIGEECVKQAFDVDYLKLRVIIAVFSPTDKQEQAKPFLFWATCRICKVILTPNLEESCLECCRMFLNWLDRDRKERR